MCPSTAHNTITPITLGGSQCIKDQDASKCWIKVFEGIWNTQKELMHAHGEHTNSTQKVSSSESNLLIVNAAPAYTFCQFKCNEIVSN